MEKLRFLLPIFLFPFIIGSSYVETFNIIRIRNNSSGNIVACGAYILPDTLLPATKLSIIEVKAKKINTLHDYHVEDNELKRFMGGEKLTIFMIDKNVYDREPWDTIRKYNKILKRYELNFQDYRSMGNEVTYP